MNDGFGNGVRLYPTKDTTKRDVHDHIEDRAGELNIDVERAHLFTKFIRSTDFSVAAF